VGGGLRDLLWEENQRYKSKTFRTTKLQLELLFELLKRNNFTKAEKNSIIALFYVKESISLGGHPVTLLVEAMCYKPEGRGFDSL